MSTLPSYRVARALAATTYCQQLISNSESQSEHSPTGIKADAFQRAPAILQQKAKLAEDAVCIESSSQSYLSPSPPAPPVPSVHTHHSRHHSPSPTPMPIIVPIRPRRHARAPNHARHSARSSSASGLVGSCAPFLSSASRLEAIHVHVLVGLA